MFITVPSFLLLWIRVLLGPEPPSRPRDPVQTPAEMHQSQKDSVCNILCGGVKVLHPSNK